MDETFGGGDPHRIVLACSPVRVFVPGSTFIGHAVAISMTGPAVFVALADSHRVRFFKVVDRTTTDYDSVRSNYHCFPTPEAAVPTVGFQFDTDVAGKEFGAAIRMTLSGVLTPTGATHFFPATKERKKKRGSKEEDDAPMVVISFPTAVKHVKHIGRDAFGSLDATLRAMGQTVPLPPPPKPSTKHLSWGADEKKPEGKQPTTEANESSVALGHSTLPATPTRDTLVPEVPTHLHVSSKPKRPPPPPPPRVAASVTQTGPTEEGQEPSAT